MKQYKTIFYLTLTVCFLLAGCTTTQNLSDAPVFASSITAEEAKNIAFIHAGFSSADAHDIKTTYDAKKDAAVYEIAFYVDAVEYSYDVDAKSGKIVSYDYEVEDYTSMPTGQISATLTAQEAKDIALKHANVNAGDAVFLRTKCDVDDGITQYELEFYVGNTEYDYEIDANNGSVLHADFDIKDIAKTTSVTVKLTASEAKNIALVHAGVNASDAVFVKAKLDKDDGVMQYEIKFYVKNKEYDYEINADSGKVLQADQDIDDDASVVTSTKLTAEEAKAIALKHAGVNASDTVFEKVKLDKDDGVTLYEIEFHVGNTEYDYDIDANTGKILQVSHDTDDQSKTTTASILYTTLTAEDAKAIALKHAGVKASDAVFEKAKLDKDDGITLYEIAFYAGNIKYEYEIDANSGNIQSFDQD